MNKDNKIRTCLKCGDPSHDQKQCNAPITSWGIILIKNGKDNMDKKTLLNLKFLLIRRKHSLGFSEFVRGKYIPQNVEGVKNLFKQMVPAELQMLKEKEFDEILKYFWGKTSESEVNNTKAYIDSKTKFMTLKFGDSIERNLEYYLKNVDPEYNEPEWGFPKGRKKKGEDDKVCAIREFCEETDLCENDIKILDIEPFTEQIIGTDGINYKHIYYLAETINDKQPHVIESETEHNEVGDIGFFNYVDAIEKIRDYHIEKKKIINKITEYYATK